jgi:hypothetical protein
VVRVGISGSKELPGCVFICLYAMLSRVHTLHTCVGVCLHEAPAGHTARLLHGCIVGCLLPNSAEYASCCLLPNSTGHLALRSLATIASLLQQACPIMQA